MADNELAEKAAAFLPAIAALTSDLTDLEGRAAETRRLIDALSVRAGIAADPSGAAVAAMPTPAPATKPPPRAYRRRRSSQASRPGPAKPTAAPAKPGNAVDQLAKITAAIAEAEEQAAAATRDHDAEKLNMAIAARARAERRAGELLISLAGRLRPLPGITKFESKKYRRAAVLSEKDFEDKVQRAQRRAVAALRPERHAPKRTPDKSSPSFSPRPTMKLTPWKEDADGSLARTLTAEVDGEASRSTARP
jgi:hypothetical protein